MSRASCFLFVLGDQWAFYCTEGCTETLKFNLLTFQSCLCCGDNPPQNMKLQLPGQSCTIMKPRRIRKAWSHSFCLIEGHVWLHQPRQPRRKHQFARSTTNINISNLLFLHCSKSNQHNLEGVNKSWLRWATRRSLSLLSLNKLYPISAQEHVRRDNTSC